MSRSNGKQEGRAQVIEVDPVHPDDNALAPAAEALASGQIVAFPTETVYGLGANALDEAAVEAIFTAKGRPADNPLIVHVADIDGARKVTASWPEAAERLAEAFWPGPLTLVLPRADDLPDRVTASLDTVAVRLPAHPVARRLIELAGVPVAAPSANRYTAVSPTRASHVVEGLGGRVDFIVDAGPTDVGVESTIVSLTGARPEILRPGMITVPQIERLVGRVTHAAPRDRGPKRSPGRAATHYAPGAQVQLVDTARDVVDDLGADERVGWLVYSPLNASPAGPLVLLEKDAEAYARELYHALRRLDASGCETIIVEWPPEGPAWRAVRDRLRRAASSV